MKILAANQNSQKLPIWGMIAINEQVEFVTMNDREKYLFDLQGFLVVRDFLSNTEVSVLNQAIDANPDKRFEHPRADLDGTPLDGEFGPFWHYDGMLTWPDPWCQPFRHLLAHPKVIPYLNTLLGRGWKLDHSVDILTATTGCQGMGIHGSGNVTFNGSRFYAYQNNRMRCGLIVCEYYLTDVNPGDGGLCVIPGSHKANFPCPDDIRMWETNQEIVFSISAKAGDLVIFNEAKPWCSALACSARETCGILPLYTEVPSLCRWSVPDADAGMGFRIDRSPASGVGTPVYLQSPVDRNRRRNFGTAPTRRGMRQRILENI